MKKMLLLLCSVFLLFACTTAFIYVSSDHASFEFVLEAGLPSFSACGLADPDEAVVLDDEEALNILTLLNRCQRLSRAFVPPDLSPLDVPTVRVLEGTHHLMRAEAARAAELLFADADAAGLSLVASSAFRSYDWQVFLHENAVAELGVDAARRISAIPGHSEHQLGLALDVSTAELNGALVTEFANTEEGKWLKDNAHRFGFIISYPEGSEPQTSFVYEPWHIRYVGLDAANEIFESGLLFEAWLWSQV